MAGPGETLGSPWPPLGHPLAYTHARGRWETVGKIYELTPGKVVGKIHDRTPGKMEEKNKSSAKVEGRNATGNNQCLGFLEAAAP
jgi:hypothetical protein